MRKLILGLAALLFSSSMCLAQFTTVTATVVDSDTTVWANATYSFSFQPGINQSNPAEYTYNGAALDAAHMQGSGAANGSGVISFSVYQNTLLSPVPSSYNVTVCPNASTNCSTINFTTSAGSLSLSAAINAAITAPRFLAVSGAFGYNDTEAQLQLKPGSTYWNVTSSVLRCYNGTTWGVCSSGGGSGTVTDGAGTTTVGLVAQSTAVVHVLAYSATLANGTLATTQSAADNSTKVATTAYADAAFSLPARYKGFSCQPGFGDGLNATTAGTYLQTTCLNTTGATITITGVKCFTDNNGTSTLNVSAHTLGALLTGAVTCTNSYAAGTQSANVLLTNGDYLNFTYVADGTSKQSSWVVTVTY